MRTTLVLCLSKDFEAEFAITRKSATTCATEPAAGLTGVTFHWAATKGGATVHADLTLNATERSGKLVTYSSIFETADLVARLASI